MSERWIVGGSTGLVGTALCQRLSDEGHEVVRLVRPSTRSVGGATISWDPKEGVLAAEELKGATAVVHLGGVGIFSGRWTESRRQAILQSRVQSSRLIADRLAQLEDGPAFVCASAIGYYGSRGDEELREGSERGTGFLADVCVAWEEATQSAKDAGVRVVNGRIGSVLSPDGGAMQLMLPAFKMGMGGKLGDGGQNMSRHSLYD